MFKKGDVVRRINSNYGELRVGFYYKVMVAGPNFVNLEGYPESFSPSNFQLVIAAKPGLGVEPLTAPKNKPFIRYNAL